MAITIRSAQASDADGVSRLILGLVDYFLPDRDSAGGRVFLASVTPQAVAERMRAPEFRCWLAEDAAGLRGFAALRDESHLYHLFVDAAHHRQGIARALWRHVLGECSSAAFTVNSSLYAAAMYERFGFIASDVVQDHDGMVFVPMRYLRDA